MVEPIESPSTPPQDEAESPLLVINRDNGWPVFSSNVIALWDKGEGIAARKQLLEEAKHERDPALKALMLKHADDTRLWLSPIKSAPTMYTLNGVGTMLYGSYRPHEDGTHIATLWFVLLFVPILPLGAYLVLPAADRGWHFLAKAPLPPVARVMRLVSLAAALVGFSAVGYTTWEAGAQTTVWAYNGYDVPITVAVAGSSQQVAPMQAQRFDGVPTQPMAFSASLVAAGPPLFERHEADLSAAGHGKVVVYNIGGRGMLLLRHHAWGAAPPQQDELLTAEPIQILDGIDYPFEAPPERMSVREGSSKFAIQLDDLSETELPQVLNFLVKEERFDDAVAMLHSELRLHPENLTAANHMASLLSRDAEQGKPLFKALIAKHPGEVELHRAYQQLATPATNDAFIEEYRQLLAENPGSAMHHYLLGRLLPASSDEALDLYNKALSLDATFGYPLWALSWRAMERHDYETALQLTESFADLSPLNAAMAWERRLRLSRILSKSQSAAELLAQAQSFGADESDLPRWQRELYNGARRGALAMADYLDVEQRPSAVKEIARHRFDTAKAERDETWARLEQLTVAETSADAEAVRALLSSFTENELAETELAWRYLKQAMSHNASDADQAEAMRRYGEPLLQLNERALLISAAAAGAPLEAKDKVLEKLRSRNINTAFLTASSEQLQSGAWLESQLDELTLELRGSGYFCAYKMLSNAGGAAARSATESYRALARRFSLPGELPALGPANAAAQRRR